tara:strand:- start:912 stop:1091 length:180 start_codon:yes stop_codon:yes gene_type:complete
MSFQIIDNTRGVVLQEFETKDQALKGLERISSEADVTLKEPVKKVTRKRKTADVEEEGN